MKYTDFWGHLNSKQLNMRRKFFAVFGISAFSVCTAIGFTVLFVSEDFVGKFVSICPFLLAIFFGCISYGYYHYARKLYIQALKEEKDPLLIRYLQKESCVSVWRLRQIMYSIICIVSFCLLSGAICILLLVEIESPFKWLIFAVCVILDIMCTTYNAVMAVKAHIKMKDLKCKKKDSGC